MDDQPPQRRATLARGPGRREQDRPLGQLEVRARAHDHRIVAAQLEQRPAEALRDPRTDRAAHRRRSGRRDQRDARVVDQRLADLAAALDELDQPSGASPNRSSARRISAITASAASGVFSLGFQMTGSPHTSASAAFHAHTATGKLNALITSTGPNGCHCSIIRWFGPLAGDGQAVELARQADREVADVDHLLDLAEAFGEDLAGFDRDQPRQRLLRGAQFLAEQPHQLAPARCRDAPPGEECRCGSGAGGVGVSDRYSADFGAVDRRAADQVATRCNAELLEERRGFFGRAHASRCLRSGHGGDPGLDRLVLLAEAQADQVARRVLFGESGQRDHRHARLLDRGRARSSRRPAQFRKPARSTHRK